MLFFIEIINDFKFDKIVAVGYSGDSKSPLYATAGILNTRRSLRRGILKKSSNFANTKQRSKSGAGKLHLKDCFVNCVTEEIFKKISYYWNAIDKSTFL